MARGELHCVGATTLDEYRKHVEKDAALARRFQPVFVSQPTVEDTISILRGLKEKYEAHHGVRITDPAIIAAATLSDRYIADRFLPDKAIDLIDEAAARQRMQVDSKPEELDELDRRIMQLKIEQEALKKETDTASKDRLKKLGGELAELQEKSDALTARWKAEKDKLGQAAKLKEELDAARNALAQAQRKGDYAEAGRLTYDTIPTLEKKLQEAESQSNSVLVDEAVTANHVAQVVSRWTGVPVDKMLEGEREKLLKMEEEIMRRVVGQREAVRRRLDRGPARPRRPAGSEPSDRLVHVLGPNRRRQDGAHQGAGRLPVRRRERDGAHRHVRVHGEALGRTAHRRASRLCRLRGRRSLDRGDAGAGPIRSCCSTRSRRRIRTSSTSSCRCSTTDDSRTGRGARSISATCSLS